MNCHSPTQPNLKVGIDKVMGWPTPPTPHHTTHPPTETFKALPGNPGSWFLVCNLILTQLDEIWKKTSIFLKMEDDLNFFQMEDNLNFDLGNPGSWFSVCHFILTQLDEQWKTTSIFFLNGRRMEEDLNIFSNGRQPQFFSNGRRPQFWSR
jgi:hypothetical protein